MKRFTFYSASAAMLTALVAVPFVLQAQDPPNSAPPSATPPTDSEMGEPIMVYSLPAELTDPAFDKYVDISLLGRAWSSKDSALLTDIALQLAEGERVLMRAHRAGSAEDMLLLAMNVATKDGDKGTVSRIANAAKALKLDKVVTASGNAEKLASASRADEPALKVSLDQANMADIAIYGRVLDEIRSADLLYDVQRLKILEGSLGEFKNLTDTQRDYLKKIIGEARTAAKDAPPSKNTVVATITKLDGESRQDAGEIVHDILHGVDDLFHGHGGQWGHGQWGHGQWGHGQWGHGQWGHGGGGQWGHGQWGHGGGGQWGHGQWGHGGGQWGGQWGHGGHHGHG